MVSPTALSRRYRHAYLLAALVLMLLVKPFLDGDSVLGISLVDLFWWIMVAAGTLASAENKRQLLLVAFTAVGGVGARAMASADGFSGPWYPVYLAFGFAFAVSLATILLRRVFAASRVTADTIFGAINVYLLLGLTWIFAYGFVHYLDVGAFEFGGRTFTQVEVLQVFGGFSFTTLTTLGYGNIHPLTHRAEALTSMQAIVGQLYLTVLVARLVGLQISQREASSSAPV